MTLYLWIKSLHVIAVISWMAGLLYLPRLYVYHCGVAPGSEASEMLKVMERRLLRAIMNPALFATLGLGLWLIHLIGIENFRLQGWLHVKLALVLLLFVFHMKLAGWRKAFARDERPKNARFFRIMNELPAVLMIAIVLLAVGKPF